MVGDPNKLGRNWELFFGGEPGTAARRADKFLQLCRDDGQWLELHAEAPSGQQTRMYVQPDKCRKQVRLEICTRKLLG
eukprot:915291-Karenia_brevis.AAC.1